MKKTHPKISVIIEKTGTGFSAYAEDHPVYSTGKTMTELIENVYEAVALYYEDSKIQMKPDNIKFELDFKQFFKSYKVLNSKGLAKKIHMNHTLLSQYIQGHKKPSPTQAGKIMSGIHRIGKELSDMNLIYHR